MKDNTRRKILSATFFRNVWLLSLLIFIGNIVYVVLSPDNSSLPEGKLLIFILVLISSFIIGSLSFIIGSLSFLLWILFRINNRLSTNEGYSSFRNKAMKVVKKSLLVIPILFILFLLSWMYLFSTTLVLGDSMPSYKDRSTQIVCKICKDIKREDVVVYSNPKENKEYIGRIVALPNENITIEKNSVLINGSALTERYADWSNWSMNQRINITLGMNEYLALFDKREAITEMQDFIDIHKFNRDNLVGKLL